METQEEKETYREAIAIGFVIATYMMKPQLVQVDHCTGYISPHTHH